MKVLNCSGAALLVACLLTPAFGDPITLTSTVRLSNSYGNTNGGEFLAEPADFPFSPVTLGTGLQGRFETYCIELNEVFHWNTWYYVDISSSAILGGGGGSPDPLDPKTAYLYERFVTGVLLSYVYDVTDGGIQRTACADDLQHVIWYIEQEEAISWTPGDNSRRDLFYQDAQNNAASDIGNVRVMNLFGDAAGTVMVQDQLVLIPEPAAVALAGAALLLFRKRRMR